jgi:hypothetical protein
MMRSTLAGGLQGVYIGGSPSLRRRASLRSSEVGLYFVEFGSTYNTMQHVEVRFSNLFLANWQNSTPFLQGAV